MSKNILYIQQSIEFYEDAFNEFAYEQGYDDLKACLEEANGMNRPTLHLARNGQWKVSEGQDYEWEGVTVGLPKCDNTDPDSNDVEGLLESVYNYLFN